jgi:hypothetical protein
LTGVRRSAVVALLAVSSLTGCVSDDATTSASTIGQATTTPTTVADIAFDRALHDELIEMAERDQAGRTGRSDPEGDPARTARLIEIVDVFGWPIFDLVGEDGEDAAWLIAQHSDQDPEFQARAVELLREAVEAGQASPGNLAYLEDRVLVGKGEPQVYGTQIRCGADGPEPATPISEEATLDERRIAAGLQPLSVYYEELAEICAAEG